MAKEVEITPNDLNSVADKIDALDMSDAEQAIVGTILARAAAAEGDVEGFASYTATDDLWQIKIAEKDDGWLKLTRGGQRTAKASGFLLEVSG